MVRGSVTCRRLFVLIVFFARARLHLLIGAAHAAELGGNQRGEARGALLEGHFRLTSGLHSPGYLQCALVLSHPESAEMLGRVADRAVQVFGGMGYCKDLPIERFYRDARIFRIFDGTSEIHRTVVARSALKRGAALWDIGA